MKPCCKSPVAPLLLRQAVATFGRGKTKLAKPVHILNFLVTNLGTEVSRTNDMHEDECTSNQVFAGSDPIIIL